MLSKKQKNLLKSIHYLSRTIKEFIDECPEFDETTPDFSLMTRMAVTHKRREKLPSTCRSLSPDLPDSARLWQDGDMVLFASDPKLRAPANDGENNDPKEAEDTSFGDVVGPREILKEVKRSPDRYDTGEGGTITSRRCPSQSRT